MDVDKSSYEILMSLKYEHQILLMLEQWFLIPNHLTSNNLDLVVWSKDSENNRDTFFYEIDGIVAKIDDRAKSKSMSVRDGRPKGQIAIKFKPRGGETILNKVVWQVGQTGALTPVGEVNPVGVGGITIKRVTLCNMDEIERLGIAVGDTVEVIRAGDVIPKLSKRIRVCEQRKMIYPPRKCPECGSKTVNDDGVKIFCVNNECPGQSLGRIMTWIKKRNILNLGIGIVKAAEIDLIEQLYYKDMTLDVWSNIEMGNGILGEKRAKKVMEALEKSRSVSLPEFLGSIGIKGVGRSLCKDLCEGLRLTTIDDVMNIRPRQIKSLEGFGLTRAHDFCDWILEHEREIETLAFFMNFKDQSDIKICNYYILGRDGAFKGETICFTGKSPKTRPEMSQLAESAGASVSNSVNANTTILVIADTDSMSSKAVKARKRGIRLILPEDFLPKVGV